MNKKEKLAVAKAEKETKQQVKEILARFQAEVDAAHEHDEEDIAVNASDLELILLYIDDLKEGRMK